MAICAVGQFLFLMLLAASIHLYQCEENDLGYYPVLLTENVHYRYLTMEKNRKLDTKGTKVKRLRVYDDMECIGRCTRIGDSCKSVNYKKEDTDGLHLCELLIKDHDYKSDALPQKIFDNTYQHISVENPFRKSCAEVYKNNGRRNGVYNIAPVPSLSLSVYCDMTTAGGGWTVIQKRIDGSVDFYRDWAQYKKGFGNKLGEYWLGLDNMHAMTSQRGYKLRIDMEDFNGNTRYAEYENFTVADESVNYRLKVGGFSGNTGNAMAVHNNMSFSTKDRGNLGCANGYKGAWWYENCHHTNPNGEYYQSPGRVPGKGLGILWIPWTGYRQSLKRIEMKIQPKD